MMRSMYSGISGLKGFQSSMDVIGNNIANVNTVGYKGSRTTFQSMLQQTIVGAKSPEEGGRGGTNAQQIGLGSQLGSIGKIMTQGSFQNTGKKTDLGIQGDGFYVLSDGVQDFYSRAGNFELDEDGSFIQPSTGMKLQGWIAKVDPKTGQRFLDLDKPPKDLFIQAGMTMPAKATSNADLGGNLNSDVGIEPLTITVKNPDDPTKTYKVRFSFEKMPPYDTKRLFSSSTIKYTWNAELVDWNAESPSEIPELDKTTGMVELNQFGQIEKFYQYPESALKGDSTLQKLPFIESVDLAADMDYDSPSSGNDSVVYTDNSNHVFNTSGEFIKPQEGIEMEYVLTESSNPVDGNYDYELVTTGTDPIIDFSAGTNNLIPASGDEIIAKYQETVTSTDQTGTYSLNDAKVTDWGNDAIIDAKDFDVTIEYDNGNDQTYTHSTTSPSFFEYDTTTRSIELKENALNDGTDPMDLSNIANVQIEYMSEKVFLGNGNKQDFTLEGVTAADIEEVKIRVDNENLEFDAANQEIKFNEDYCLDSGEAGTADFGGGYNVVYKDLAPFDNQIIDSDASKTYFNYSPDGDSEIETKVRETFDENNDGILDKIINNVTYNPEESEYEFSPALSSTGSVTNFNFTDIKPASGDQVNVSYYTQEDIQYLSSKSKYNISGPIVNSQGTESITVDDLVVRSVNSSGTVINTFAANSDYTYDENTGTVTLLSTPSTNTEKIRIEYCTKDSFTGDGTNSDWDLSKKAIQKPSELDEGLGTNGENSSVSLDLQYTLNEDDERLVFRADYPSTGDAPQRYSVEYANPSNPQDFDTVDVRVGGENKAQVSIPKTGDIKFFDKNDTQNYVVGDYDSPRYTTSSRLYDSLGNDYTVYFEFQKITENRWAWKAREDTGIPISYVDDNEKTYTPSPNDLSSIVGGVVEFDSGGRVASQKAIRQNGKVEDDISITRIKFDPGEMVDDGAAPPPEEGASAVSAGIDFSELVQFSSDFSASVTSQDGNAMGVLQNYSINPAGEVVGTFSNGKSDTLGQLAMALFNNPAGLTELGSTLYQVSANSGNPMVGLPDSGGRGTISPGVLEMSNVDLAEEFTGMVVVQRAFQANARTVTTTDQILQELVNLKR